MVCVVLKLEVTKHKLQILAVTLFCLACLDIITTLNLVNQTGSWENELNPIAVYTWSYIGIEWSVALKLLLFIFICFVVPSWAMRDTELVQKYTYNGLIGVNLLYVFFVVCACFGGFPVWW